MDRNIRPEDRGRFIVIYGANNLGKSKQLDMLEEEWKAIGRPYTRIKYPIYESPSGIVINLELRGAEEDKLHLSAEELQELFAYDRRDFEPELNNLLSEGDVFAEDYEGTGKTWGLTYGVDRAKLEEFNKGLKRPDVVLCLDGERFSTGIEKGHKHESAGIEVWWRQIGDSIENWPRSMVGK